MASEPPPSPPHHDADRSIGKSKHDRLDRKPFAQRIVSTILDRTSPESLVIGIYGPWGSGKTSVLDMIQEDLYFRQSRTTVIKFNPWFFQDVAQLMRSFFETVASELEQSIETKPERLGKALRRYGQLLDPVLDKAPLPVPDLKQVAEMIGPSTTELSKLRQRIESILERDGRRVVVLIDDIDRLDRREIHALFKVVKLIADFRRVVYVLAFDEVVVADALSDQYSQRDGVGQSFLEKIVQVPLQLPLPDSDRLRDLALSGILEALATARIELSEKDRQTFIETFDRGLQVMIVTPRMARRFANIVQFALPLLKGEVHPGDLVLMEAIRLFYPHLYKTIREHPRAYLQATREHTERLQMSVRTAQEEQKQRDLAVFESGFEGLNAAQRHAANQLIHDLFPRVNQITSNYFYEDNYQGAGEYEKRISSTRYFPRYFQYSIPFDDVADLPVEMFLSQVSTMVPAQAVGELKGLCRQFPERQLFIKIAMKEPGLSQGSAPVLAEALAIIGHSVSSISDGIYWAPRSIVQDIILRLIRKVELISDRDKLAGRIMEMEGSLPFKIELWHRLETRPSYERQFGRLLSLECENRTQTALSGLLQKKFLEGPFHEEVARHDAYQFYHWWAKLASSSEVAKFLADYFAEDPARSGIFLAKMVPIHGIDENVLYPLGREQPSEYYGSIREFIAPESLYSFLMQAYGDALDVPSEGVGIDVPIDLQAARQFACFHLGRLADSAVTHTAEDDESGPS